MYVPNFLLSLKYMFYYLTHWRDEEAGKGDFASYPLPAVSSTQVVNQTLQRVRHLVAVPDGGQDVGHLAAVANLVDLGTQTLVEIGRAHV